MKREKLQQLAHLVAGVATLVYGFDTFEKGDFIGASCYLTLGLLILIVAGAHTWMATKFIRGDIAINLLEVLTIIYAARNYKNKAHDFLYYSMMLVGVMYFVLAVIHLFLSAETRSRSYKRKKKRRRTSQLFNQQKLVESKA
jgi:hypothetical protein